MRPTVWPMVKQWFPPDTLVYWSVHALIAGVCSFLSAASCPQWWLRFVLHAAGMGNIHSNMEHSVFVFYCLCLLMDSSCAWGNWGYFPVKVQKVHMRCKYTIQTTQPNRS